MSKKQGNARNPICVLRVNIHCDGCKKKVKKLLQKIEGVDATMIDAELGKVTVSGYVHPNILIEKLVKSGKHAELWAAQKNNPYAAQNLPGNQFHGLQFESLRKPQKGGNGKGFNRDLNKKMGHEVPKSVKFDLPEDELSESDGELSGSEDEEDGFELDLGRRPPSRIPARGGGQHGKKEKKNGTNGHGKKGKSGGGRAKKGGIFGIRLLFFGGFGRKKKGKNCCAGKKGGGGGGGCMKPGVIELKNGGKNGGWVPGNGKSGGKGMSATKNGSNNKPRGGGGGKNSRGGGKDAEFQGIGLSDHLPGGGGGGAGGYGVAGGGGAGGYGVAGGGGFAGVMGNYPMGQMGNNSMGHMGNYPVGPMGNNSFSPMGYYPAVSQMGSDPTRQMSNYQAVQGMPAPGPINGGYYPGMGPTAMNHHQYMGMMMMNQAHPQFNGMFHPTMYGRPPPATGYGPNRGSDGYTNMFDDENTESCSIM